MLKAQLEMLGVIAGGMAAILMIKGFYALTVWLG